MKNLKPTHCRCICAACNESFNSVVAFDKHRVGTKTRRCLTAGEMYEKGMRENADGYWCTKPWKDRADSRQ